MYALFAKNVNFIIVLNDSMVLMFICHSSHLIPLIVIRTVTQSHFTTTHKNPFDEKLKAFSWWFEMTFMCGNDGVEYKVKAGVICSYKFFLHQFTLKKVLGYTIQADLAQQVKETALSFTLVVRHPLDNSIENVFLITDFYVITRDPFHDLLHVKVPNISRFHHSSNV